MDPQDRLQKALQKIGHARGSIIRVAAEWQSGGHETSPLTDPLCEIQEALSQLESLSAALSPRPPAAFVPRAGRDNPSPRGS